MKADYCSFALSLQYVLFMRKEERNDEDENGKREEGEREEIVEETTLFSPLFLLGKKCFARDEREKMICVDHIAAVTIGTSIICIANRNG